VPNVYGSSDAWVVLGGPTQTWGQTLTTDDINATFGCLLSCMDTFDEVGKKARIDAIRCTIWHET
jgi:hypothetical protein